MEPSDAPQILQLAKHSVGHSVYGSQWVPASARFVAYGSRTKGTGSLLIGEVLGRSTQTNADVELPNGIRCGTFGASGLADRQLALGDFDGNISVHDVDVTDKENAGVSWSIKGHSGVVNCIDGCVGSSAGPGSPEIVTGGRDGAVRVWDTRKKDAPVCAFVGSSEGSQRDCWSVALGNSVTSEERVVAAGYDNGDIKVFDLRKNSVKHSVNVGNGVCDLQFDRKEIAMNKLAASCLESMMHVFDMRTLHPTRGYAQLAEQAPGSATAWSIRHLPQNREVIAVLAGSGDVFLYRYHYPDQRRVTDSEGKHAGVAGSLEKVGEKQVAEQPIGSLDWSPDKLGLAVCTSFDQAVRVLAITKLDKLR